MQREHIEIPVRHVKARRKRLRQTEIGFPEIPDTGTAAYRVDFFKYRIDKCHFKIQDRIREDDFKRSTFILRPICGRQPFKLRFSAENAVRSIRQAASPSTPAPDVSAP